MNTLIFGKEYNLSDLDSIESLSDVIQDSQVNSVRQIAQALLTSFALLSTEKKDLEIMELDGEKLLADLEKRLEALKAEKNREKLEGDYAAMQFIFLQIKEISAVIGSIKSGDYTIEDKG